MLSRMAEPRALVLPPPELRFMAEDDDRFLRVAGANAALLFHTGLESHHKILDVGSGYGRLAYGLAAESRFLGLYDGFDILSRHVAWCREAFDHLPRFRFTHVDVLNTRYNPTGTIEPKDFRFPFEDATFDYCSVFSVFTHLRPLAVENYLSEISRVLRPGGVCLATFFLFDESRLAAVMSPECELPMVHELDSATRYYSEADPLHAISYRLPHVDELWRQQAFTLTDQFWGSWAGLRDPYRGRSNLDPRPYQDTLVLTKNRLPSDA